MKTTMEIPDCLYKEAKACADSRGVPLRQIVEEGLRLIIQQSRQPCKPFRLRDSSFGGHGLQSDMSWPDIRRTIYQGRGD